MDKQKFVNRVREINTDYMQYIIHTLEQRALLENVYDEVISTNKQETLTDEQLKQTAYEFLSAERLKKYQGALRLKKDAEGKHVADGYAKLLTTKELEDLLVEFVNTKIFHKTE